MRNEYRPDVTVTPLKTDDKDIIGFETNIFGHVARQVASLQDSLVREQLIAAGWTPPPQREPKESPAFRYGITGAKMMEIPRETWPDAQRNNPSSPWRVWMSKDYMAQFYRPAPKDEPAMGRLSIHSVHRTAAGWVDNIPWETLQRIKAECGFQDLDAIEIYPAERDVVNVANIRHLWLVPRSYLPFAWRRS